MVFGILFMVKKVHYLYLYTQTNLEGCVYRVTEYTVWTSKYYTTVWWLNMTFQNHGQSAAETPSCVLAFSKDFGKHPCRDFLPLEHKSISEVAQWQWATKGLNPHLQQGASINFCNFLKQTFCSHFMQWLPGVHRCQGLEQLRPLLFMSTTKDGLDESVHLAHGHLEQ